jgi:hypothetical protein
MAGEGLIVEEKRAFRSRDGPACEIGFVGCIVQLETLETHLMGVGSSLAGHG